MKPIVKIDILGKVYPVEATFDFLSEVEDCTSVGLIRLLIHKEDMKLVQIKAILTLIVKGNIEDDILKNFILKNFTYATNKIIEILEIGFLNPNPRAKVMTDIQTADETKKKN